MKSINPKALVTILIMFCLNLGAQDLSKKMLFKHVGPKEGLAKLNLQNVLVDQQGILWISTTNGLYSYDGISILLHKSSTFGKNILSNNRITGLLEDRSGQLWCGSESLCKYDPCSKKWSCFFCYN
jgi:ligand-binding sensor domain-containing protein